MGKLEHAGNNCRLETRTLHSIGLQTMAAETDRQHRSSPQRRPAIEPAIYAPPPASPTADAPRISRPRLAPPSLSPPSFSPLPLHKQSRPEIKLCAFEVPSLLPSLDRSNPELHICSDDGVAGGVAPPPPPPTGEVCVLGGGEGGSNPGHAWILRGLDCKRVRELSCGDWLG